MKLYAGCSTDSIVVHAGCMLGEHFVSDGSQ